ncbi:MAG: hypothetical protein GXO78_13840 [Calditrichaeota bacterium]|nr:hypothetical protein [Calditrichota bacterium]
MERLLRLIFLVMLGLGITGLAQEHSGTRFGVGIDLSGFGTESGMENVYDNFYFPIQIGSSLLIEPELGFSRKSVTEGVQKSSRMFVRAGSGFMIVSQKNNTQLYIGLRGYLLLDSFKIEGDVLSRSESLRRIFLGPVTGAFYMITPNLAIGGEVLVEFRVHEGGAVNGRSVELSGSSFSRTVTRVLLRWFF